MDVGEKIKQERQNANMSQKELGEKLGVSQAMIGQYESGKRKPKVETLTKIANALDVPISKLTFYASMVDEEAPGFVKPTNNLSSSKKSFQTIETNDDNFLKLANSYHQLNKEGRQKALDQVEMLAKIPEYRRDESDID